MFKTKFLPIVCLLFSISILAEAQVFKPTNAPIPDRPEARDDTLIVSDVRAKMYNILMNDYIDFKYKTWHLSILQEPKGKLEIVDQRGVDMIKYQYFDAESEETDNFTYQICDDAGKCDSASVLIVKCPAKITKLKPVEKVIAERGEDVEIDYPDQVIRFSTLPKNGTISWSADSSKAIYNSGEFLGIETFDFTVYQDKGPICGMCHFTSENYKIIAIPPDDENQPPVANTDEIEIIGNKKTTFEPMENDTDPEGSLHVKLISVTKPTNGKMRRTPTKITYTPDSGFNGTETLRYEVCDYNGACTEGIININVKKRQKGNK